MDPDRYRGRRECGGAWRIGRRDYLKALAPSGPPQFADGSIACPRSRIVARPENLWNSIGFRTSLGSRPLLLLATMCFLTDQDPEWAEYAFRTKLTATPATGFSHFHETLHFFCFKKLLFVKIW